MVTATETDSAEEAMMTKDSKKRPLPTTSEKTNNDAVTTTASASTKHNPDDDAASNKSKKQKNTVTPKRKTDPQVLVTRRLIQECCRTNDLARALQVFDQAVKDNTRVEPTSLYNLISLCDGLSENPIHIGTPKSHGAGENHDAKQQHHQQQSPSAETPPVVATVSLEDRKKHAFRIKAYMDEHQYPMNESAYSAMIKLLCKTNDLDQAHEFLTRAEQDKGHCKCKLRLYSSLLIAYCCEQESPQLSQALHIWERLTLQQLAITEREYMALIQACCRTSATTHNTTKAASVVMERVLSDLAQDVMVPSRACSQAIADWFSSPGAAPTTTTSSTTTTTTNDSSMQYAHKCQEQLANIRNEQQRQSAVPLDYVSMGPVTHPQGWAISPSCAIQPDGTLTEGCLQGQKLQPVFISDDTWKFMMQANETIVQKGGLDQHKSQFQGGKKGKKRRLDEDLVQKRQKLWNSFNKYLSRVDKIDVMIDGANVGYFKQNYDGARQGLDFRQVDWMVQHLHRQGKSVLVFLHQRHLNYHHLAPEFRPIVQSWRDTRVLYSTPTGMNDDWFWMHAALHWKSLFVSNDEMRDHHFQMLAPRSFFSWKDRHQVHFSFGGWRNESDPSSRGERQREVILEYPELYSRRIQKIGEHGLIVPLPKRGDTNRFLDGKHEENDEESPQEERYLCICAKNE